MTNEKTDKPAFFQALGVFIHEYSRTEAWLWIAASNMAGLSSDIARALMGSLRPDAAMDTIKRLLEVVDQPASVKASFEKIFAQLRLVNEARNHLLHYGTAFHRGTALYASNYLIALTPDRRKDIPMSVEILRQLRFDLDTINAHLLSYINRKQNLQPQFKKESDAKILRAWTYKPPPQSQQHPKRPPSAPKQSRQHGASRK